MNDEHNNTKNQSGGVNYKKSNIKTLFVTRHVFVVGDIQKQFTQIHILFQNVPKKYLSIFSFFWLPACVSWPQAVFWFWENALILFFCRLHWLFFPYAK